MSIVFGWRFWFVLIPGGGLATLVWISFASSTTRDLVGAALMTASVIGGTLWEVQSQIDREELP